MNGFSITNGTNHANLKYFLVHSFAWTVIITLGQISGHQIEQTMEAPHTRGEAGVFKAL